MSAPGAIYIDIRPPTLRWLPRFVAHNASKVTESGAVCTVDSLPVPPVDLTTVGTFRSSLRTRTSRLRISDAPS